MKKITFLMAAALCMQLYAQFPNRNYSSNELYKVISPQMGRNHINQPSAISGHVILAGNGNHQVWNISDPYKPSLVTEFSSPIPGRGEKESHQVSYMKDATGNLYFVTISGKGIDIWNINDITNPTNVAAMELPGIDFGDVSNAVWGITCQGDIIYVGATNNGLYVVDAKDKTNPVLIKTLSSSQIGGILAGPLFNIGNLLVITTPKQTSGIATLDISDSKNPKLLDSYKPTYKPWLSYIGGFYGKHATLINPFQMIDVTTDPSNITPISSTPTEKSEYVSFDDDKLFLGGLRGGSEGIWKYDVSNPASPSLIGRVVGRDSRWDDQFSVPIGNLVIMADDQYVNGFVGAVVAIHDTQKDTTPPRVIYTNPKSDAVNQSLTTKVGISLSSWINFDKVNTSSFKVRKVGGNDIPGAFGWTYTTLTFEPSQPLEANSTYEVILSGNEIQDLVGNALGTNYTFKFSTGNEIISSEDLAIETPQAVNVGSQVNWNVVNPNTNYVYKWDTGNGNEVTGPSPTFSYNTAGRYNVVVSAFKGSSVQLEAEAGVLNGAAIGSSNIGFTGTGYVDFPTTTGENVYTEVDFDNAIATNNATITIRYAIGLSAANRPLNLTINGGEAILVDFPSTGGWATYKEVQVPNVSLPKGAVKVRLSATAGSQGGNIDNITVTNNRNQSNTEAESGIVSGGAAIGSGNTGFSGTGFVDFPSTTGANVYTEIKLNNSVATTNGSIVIRYAMGAAGNRPLNLSINGGAAIKVDFPSTGAWTTYEEALVDPVSLPEGEVTIRLSATAGSQGGNIDQFGIINDQGPAELISTLAFNQVVNGESTSSPSKSSTQFAKVAGKIWVVNEDANTITSINQSTLQKVDEVTVGKKPVAISYAGNNRLWVLNKDEATISVVNTTTSSVTSTITLQRASKPSALVVNNDLSKAYVSLEAVGKIVELDVASNAAVKSLQLKRDRNVFLPKPGALAIDGAGENLYVARFVSERGKAEIYKVALPTFDTYTTIALQESTGTDGVTFARGIPNYLTQMVISPDGSTLRIASKKDNIKRGIQRDGLPLQHDNTVRAIVSVVDLSTDTDDITKRLDIDNVDRCHAIAYSGDGNVMFIALPGNNEIFVADTNTNTEITRLATEEVPTHMFYDTDLNQLYVNNFLGRSVSIFDVSTIANGGSTSSKLATVNTVSNELLTAEVLLGKKLFYDASSDKLSQEGYISCASCHLDGGNDGQVWDFTNLGEGFRNTIDLVGKAGMAHGRLHWTANFDEIHDFENQIRTLNKGTGLLSDQQFNATENPLGNSKAGLNPELDALAAYITSLNKFENSPYKQSNGNLTAGAERGKNIFNDLKCYQCHSGSTFTKSSSSNNLFDVGTIKTTSGERIDKTLLGIDVPTLKGLWSTAPYLHDGSASTVREVLTTRNINGKHTDVSALSPSEMDDLIAYMAQLDDDVAPALESTLNLSVSSPREGQIFDEGSTINIQIAASITNITSAEYYINDILVGTGTSSPFNFMMNNATKGIKDVIVKAYYGNGTAIVSDCVEFEVIASAPIADGVYYMKKASSTLYLKANGASENTTSITENTGDDTKWSITNIGNNEYEIRSVAFPTGRLEVPFGDTGRGLAIATNSSVDQANHLVWKTQKIGDNYIFIPKHDPLHALDLFEGNPTVHTWEKSSANGNQIISLIPANDGNQIVVNARGVVGEESITLRVDNTDVATWTLSQTAQDYTVSTSLSGNIRVYFTNNAGRRDAFIDYIVVNGTTQQSENQTVNTAVWQNGGCGNGGNSQWMNCNGYIDYGDTTKSNTSPSSTLDDKNTIVSYPNPATNALYLEGLPEGKSHITIINILGMAVKSKVITKKSSTHKLDVSGFETGLYYIRISSFSTKKEEILKFVKQ